MIDGGTSTARQPGSQASEGASQRAKGAEGGRGTQQREESRETRSRVCYQPFYQSLIQFQGPY